MARGRRHHRPVDLPGVRRALDELDRIEREHPEALEKFARMAREHPGGGEAVLRESFALARVQRALRRKNEKTMTTEPKEEFVGLRVTPDLLHRLDAYARRLSQATGLEVSRSDAARKLLTMALAGVEWKAKSRRAKR